MCNSRENIKRIHEVLDKLDRTLGNMSALIAEKDLPRGKESPHWWMGALAVLIDKLDEK